MNERTIQDLLDREAIKEIRAQIAQALDTRDWGLFQSQFAEEVEADFTSYGLPVQKVRAEELAQSYQQNLSRKGLRTQHLFCNFRITITGDTARCDTSFVGYHFLADFEGGEEFFLRGEYQDQLTRTQTGWRIHALRFVLSSTSGNPALLAGR